VGVLALRYAIGGTLVLAPRTRYATVATPLNKPKRQDPDAHGRSQRFCPTDANASHLVAVAALVPLALSLPLPSLAGSSLVPRWPLSRDFPCNRRALAVCRDGHHPASSLLWPSSCLKLIIMGICNCHIRLSTASHFLLRISRFYSGCLGWLWYSQVWMG
jgi:hypothetical protein